MSGKKQNLVFCVLIFSAGCEVRSQSSPVQSSSLDVEKSKTADASASIKNGSDTEIVHDFGMLKPDERVSHDFVIANPSDKDWTLVKITQSCTCSVASASNQTIKAGGQETFRFDYHAPSKIADERRTITATFRDSVEHDVKLIVTAWVRPAMVSRPPSLNFGNIALGSVSSQSLEIGNFGATDWGGVDMPKAPKWLTIRRTAKVQRKWSGATPRETWSLDLEAATASLKAGAYREEIRLESSTGETVTVPVEFVAGIPVAARPTLFMLGQTEASRPVEATTILRFFADSAPCSPDRVAISCKGARVVGKKIDILAENRWKLTTRIVPDGNPGDFVAGELTVAFPGGEPSDVVIPIHAQIRPRP